jgi:hypothetical protein
MTSILHGDLWLIFMLPLSRGDPYTAEVGATVQAVMAKLGYTNPYVSSEPRGHRLIPEPQISTHMAITSRTKSMARPPDVRFHQRSGQIG